MSKKHVSDKQPTSQPDIGSANDVATGSAADQEATSFVKIPENMVSKAEDDKIDLDNDPDIKNKKYPVANPPEIEGEASFAGSAPDPSDITDEDVLEMVQDMGLYDDVTDDDQEDAELDLADEIAEDEEAWKYR